MRWTDRLSRRTTSGRYIPEVDGLRFVSILLVVGFHVAAYLALKAGAAFSPAPAEDPLARFLSHGRFGVQLFFALSGFVLALPFAAARLSGGPPVSLRAYFLRRLTRLEPPYVAALLLAAAGALAANTASAAELLPHLAASLLYLHNVVYGEPSTVLGVAWSLEVEVQFYLLAPLLSAVFFAARRAWVRRAAMVAAIVATVALQHAMGPWETPWLGWHLQWFLVGFLVADVYLADAGTAGGSRPPARTWGWDAVAVAACGGIVASWDAPSVAASLALPAAVGALYLAAFRGRATGAVLGNRWLATIGGMCYSIYLLHYLVISAVGRVTLPYFRTEAFWPYLLAQLAVLSLAVLAVCGTFFVLVERPCMERDRPARLMARLRGRRAETTGVAVATD